MKNTEKSQDMIGEYAIFYGITLNEKASFLTQGIQGHRFENTHNHIFS